jgi:hypothetical protein
MDVQPCLDHLALLLRVAETVPVRLAVDRTEDRLPTFHQQFVELSTEDMRRPRDERRGIDVVVRDAFRMTMQEPIATLAEAMSRDLGWDEGPPRSRWSRWRTRTATAGSRPQDRRPKAGA